MIASLSNNTQLQYSVTYKLWWSYCSNIGNDPYNCSKSAVLLFLNEQFHQNASYGTLNSHRSALSLLLGSCISSDDQIKRFFKGVYKLKPNMPKYVGTWNPQVVLNHIKDWVPHLDLSRELITKKLVVLLALCTAHRAQTLSLIRVDNIKFSIQGAIIIISDIVKTSAPGRAQPLLALPYFNENKDICPATVLKDYISVTIDDRSSLKCNNLFLTYRRPYKVATAQSISRWIKQTLASSGVDVSVFSGHSTRHAATSAAKSAGVSLDIIRKTAGWTTSSQTFAKFYDRPIINDSNFARAVCLQDK